MSIPMTTNPEQALLARISELSSSIQASPVDDLFVLQSATSAMDMMESSLEDRILALRHVDSCDGQVPNATEDEEPLSQALADMRGLSRADTESIAPSVSDADGLALPLIITPSSILDSDSDSPADGASSDEHTPYFTAVPSMLLPGVESIDSMVNWDPANEAPASPINKQPLLRLVIPTTTATAPVTAQRPGMRLNARTISMESNIDSVGSISPLPSPGAVAPFEAFGFPDPLTGHSPNPVRSAARPIIPTAPTPMPLAQPQVPPPNTNGATGILGRCPPRHMPAQPQPIIPAMTAPAPQPRFVAPANTPAIAVPIVAQAAPTLVPPFQGGSASPFHGAARSNPRVLTDAIFHIMRTAPIEAAAQCHLGWIVLHAIWGLTPAMFDQSVLDILAEKKTPRQAEEILLAIAAVDLRNVRNLSAFACALIKEHEGMSQVCMRFLAGMCPDHTHCEFVHPDHSSGWVVLKQRWNLSFRNIDYACLSYLCKQRPENRDAILMAFGEMNLKNVKNLSAYLSRAIRMYEASH